MIIFNMIPTRESCSAACRAAGRAAFLQHGENDLGDHRFKVGQSVLYTSGPCWPQRDGWRLQGHAVAPVRR